MSSLLEEIVLTKRQELETLTGSPERFREAQPLATPYQFEDSLRRPAGSPLRVIAECKKASPSRGLIRADYDSLQIASQYRDCGAAALSILTDSRFFQGSLEDMVRARQAGLPVLRKDFVISELQIQEARQAGADAILLIVRILSDQQLGDFLAEAERWGMSALVEIHNRAEAERAVAAGARLIGVNHRDLDTLEMNLNLTGEIAPWIRKQNPRAVLIAESGVESPEGRRQMEPQADGRLIGTALMESADIPARWRSIFA